MLFDLCWKLWHVLYQKLETLPPIMLCVKIHGEPINQMDGSSCAVMHTLLLIRRTIEFTYSFGASHLVVFDSHEKYIGFLDLWQCLSILFCKLFAASNVNVQ